VNDVLIRTASFCLAAGLLAGAASAQTTTPLTPLDKQLARVDFGITAIGQFNSSVSGTVPLNSASDAGQTLQLSPGNTLGAMGTVRYTARPYVGLEFNYTYARYTETLNNLTTGTAEAPGQLQTGVDEESFGYVITPRQQLFGLQPIVSIGAGTTRFRPTRGGGQGAPTQYRATYYYNVGLQKEFSDSHFGVRASFREAFFKAPDFLLNYLTINQHTTSIEPTIGFYVRF
jgi:hypothetical protein